MDKLDTEILNEIQWKFPLTAKPFDEIAKKFEISSDEVKDRLIQLKRKGVSVSYTHLTLPTILLV